MASAVRVKWIPHVGRVLCELPKVGEMTSGLADRCSAEANSLLDKDEGYVLQGFEVVSIDMNGYVVRTKTDHARHSQNKNKTLTKAFNSLRG